MGLFGDRGSGKSAAMCFYGIQEHLDGRQIIYYPKSYDLKVPGAIAMGPLELADVPEVLNGATVLIDEIQELLSKYRSNSTLTLKIMGFFRQVRKRGANVIFTSNDPDGINRALPNQTDIHGLCNMKEDLYCHEVGYHLPECNDTVTISVKDTSGKHGLIPYRKDGRKGYVEILAGISDVYGLYDTTSIADIGEVVDASKSTIMERAHTDAIGMGWDEFDQKLIDQIIPDLVGLGFSSITPKIFAKTLASEYDIPKKGPPLKPEIIGRRLRMIGLPPRRVTSGMTYTLPPAELLDAWKAGVYSPGDEY